MRCLLLSGSFEPTRFSSNARLLFSSMKHIEIELIFTTARIRNSPIACRLSQRHHSRVTFVSIGKRIDSLTSKNANASLSLSLAEKGATSIFCSK